MIGGRDDLLDRVGTLAQLARIDSFVEQEATARGARRLRMITGGGLEVDIHPDRAFDLGAVTYRGVQVAWLSPTGMSAPAHYDSSGTEWRRTFGGGLLATCGLDTFGPPRTTDRGMTAMHGRIGATPGTLRRADVHNGRLIVEGEIRQASVFGEHLVLRRTISAPIGGSTVRIDDTVTNAGATPTPHAVLYHCNFGWPLLDEDARLHIRAVSTESVTSAAARDRDWGSIRPPSPHAEERVYVHTLDANAPAAVIDNPRIDTRVALDFGDSLPRMAQWSMFGPGHYVLGLEPTNAVDARAVLAGEDAPQLPILHAGESAQHWMEFAFTRSGQIDTDGGVAGSV